MITPFMASKDMAPTISADLAALSMSYRARAAMAVAILSHSVSVGEPLSIERVRGIMLMVLQNIGQGYSGVRMVVLKPGNDSPGRYTPGKILPSVQTGLRIRSRPA